MLRSDNPQAEMLTRTGAPFFEGFGNLALKFSDDPKDVYYTTNDGHESIAYLDEPVRGKDVYEVDPLVQQINKEVRFPRERLPTDIYRKFMAQINQYLPPCTNEKRGHEFKHKRVRVDRSTSQKLAGKAKELLTSECMYCRQNWSGLRYPLEESERYPPGTSVFGHRRNSTKSPTKPSISRILSARSETSTWRTS